MSEAQLEQNKTDVLASSVRSVLGAVPFAGPLLAEVVGNLIPNQRIDRLTNYVKELEGKLSSIAQEKIEESLQDLECVDLIEEGFVQASRAITEERRRYIANVVGNGIDDGTIEYSESKYVLKILQELNEQEVIWLRFFMRPTIGGDKEFRDKHKNVLEPIRAHLSSDARTIERSALRESYIEHLERLGLVRSNIRFDRKTGLPEFDKFTGKPAVSHRNLTPLGRLVLKQIELSEDGSES